MKKILILITVSLLSAQSEPPLFNIEARTRVLDNDILQVVVQVDNNTELSVVSLEGFITVYDTQLKIAEEKHLVLLNKYEAELKPSGSISRSVNFKHNPRLAFTYVFHISRLQFIGDHRSYTYHPAAGLIRID